MRTKILIGLTSALVGFVIGLGWEYSANQQSLEEILQVSQEACDMRIKTIKFTCKR